VQVFGSQKKPKLVSLTRCLEQLGVFLASSFRLYANISVELVE
jgi:hypothetical protein